MENYTPMMRQYLEVKEKLKDTIVFYRLGDFYEMFFDDAIIASKELDLVLTGRNAGVEEKVPMCGIPYHAVNAYLPKLVNRGFKVAIVEQLEDPMAGKIVKRGVIKIVTPGTMMSEDIDDKNNICISSIVDFNYGYSLVIIDISTGETKAINIGHNMADLKANLMKNNIKEVVVNSNFNQKVSVFLANNDITVSTFDDDTYDENYHDLYTEINDSNISLALSLLLNYLQVTQKQLINHIQPIVIDNESDYMNLDYNSIVNLELINPIQTQSKSITLWKYLDQCKSAMGSRLLKELISRPLYNKDLILKRQSQVRILKDNLILQDDIQESLDKIYDLKRLIGRFALNSANAIDCIRLKKTLEVVPLIQDSLKDYKEFKEIIDIDNCYELYELINRAIVDDPKVDINQGNNFKKGYDEELDQLISLSNNSKEWLLNQEIKEKERTGIKNLKIGYNKVFGYYIEVSKSNIPLIKPEYGYIRKQTLTNQERYITEELKNEEEKILHAQELAIKKEIALFNDLCNKIKTYLFKLHKIADSLAYLDCIYAMSVVSDYPNYCLPKFSDSKIDIQTSRHPILDGIMKSNYVANDCKMKDNEDVMIITGPNMGGKSTYMKQIALIAIMAQMGMYVPCSKCTIPLFDAIFTRIGASDDIMSGQSTFMVEMNEANHALINATKHSLIIFDEIGRGTSTYDGMSLARAMIEYIATNIKCKTLFSTHYHELTNLDEEYDNILNYHILVHEENDDITFMYKMEKGKSSKSYGINVARLAKLPDVILNRAKLLLDDMELHSKDLRQPFQMMMIPLEEKKETVLYDMLKDVDINNLTPMQALSFLNEMKEKVKDGDNK